MFDPMESAWISPTELNFLQRIFDRVCMWCQIDRPSERADRLATYLLHEYRAGIRDETALLKQQCGARRTVQRPARCMSMTKGSMIR